MSRPYQDYIDAVSLPTGCWIEIADHLDCLLIKNGKLGFVVTRHAIEDHTFEWVVEHINKMAQELK